MLKEKYKVMDKTILIVDDDPDFQNAVKTILGNADFKCIQAYSMKEGLDTISVTKPDLVILDVMMEDISAGFRFARELRNQEKQNGSSTIPILMVTNIRNITGINFKNQMNAQLLLVDNFLEKPVEPETLIENVKKMIK